MARGTIRSRPRTDRTQISQTAQGLIAESYPRLLLISTVATPTSQQIFATAVGLRGGDVITNCVFSVGTAASGTVPTLVKAALLDKTGKVLIQSANLASDSMWTSTGMKQVPFAASATYTVLSDDLYYVAFLKNGTFASTDLQLMRAAGTATAGVAAIGSAVAPLGSQTGQTDFAANNSSQTLANNTAVAFWSGVN